VTRLEQLRIDALLSREQLAAECGVSDRTIARLEQGRGAQVATLGKLASFFKVKPSELLRDVELGAGSGKAKAA
jgi:transcriptional regulator with XRE-family HTH domain